MALRLPDSDPLNETFRIFLDIYTGTYTGGPLLTTYLDDVAIKVVELVRLDATLFAAPGGTAAWTELDGGINRADVTGPAAALLCADFINAPSFSPRRRAGRYVSHWAFDITVTEWRHATGDTRARSRRVT